MYKKNKRLWSLIVSVIMIMVLVTGCGTKEDSTASLAPNSIASSSPEAPENESKSEDKKVYTDMAGREVKLSTNIQKIICIRYMELNLLATILGDDFDKKVISLGMSVEENDFDNFKKFSEIYDLSKLKIIGSIYDDAISSEKLLEMNPDIVIVDMAFKEKSCIKKMIEVGLPVVFTDMNGNSGKVDAMYGPIKSLEMLGNMLGYSEKTSKMVAYATSKIDHVLDVVKKQTESGAKAPKLYFECGNTIPTEIGGSRGDVSNGWGYLWYKLGAKNIAVGKDMDVIDPEIVLTEDPDIIVIGGANWDKASNIMRLGYFITPQTISDHLSEYITARKGWSDLPAIKNKKLYAIHFNTPSTYPFSFAEIEYMGKILWPDAFKDVNPQADIEEFFKLYMPVKYSGTFFGSWR